MSMLIRKPPMTEDTILALAGWGPGDLAVNQRTSEHDAQLLHIIIDDVRELLTAAKDLDGYEIDGVRFTGRNQKAIDDAEAIIDYAEQYLSQINRRLHG